MKFDLYIYENGGKYKERLSIPGKEQAIIIPLLSLANSLVHASNIHESLSNPNNIPLRAIWGEFVGLSQNDEQCKLIMEKVEPPSGGPVPFGLELFLIAASIRLWLLKEGKEKVLPSELYAKFATLYFGNPPSSSGPEFYRMFLEYCKKNKQGDENNLGDAALFGLWGDVFFERVKQLVAVPTGVKITKSIKRSTEYYSFNGKTKTAYLSERAVFAELFSTQHGLLPLVWAEILHCIRNNIQVKICEQCGSIFPINNPQAVNEKYCSRGCKRRQEDFDSGRRKKMAALRKKIERAKKKGDIAGVQKFSEEKELLKLRNIKSNPLKGEYGWLVFDMCWY